MEQPRQFARSFARHCVAPGAELRQLLPFRVEDEITVHHRGNADAAKLFKRHAIFFTHVALQFRIRALHARPYVVQMIRPHAVLQAVLPAIAARRNRLMVFANQNRLNPRRTQLDAEHRAAPLNQFRRSGHKIPSVNGNC